MPIPVFHDDQHGTAIISAAGLINAAALTGRKLETMKIVVKRRRRRGDFVHLAVQAARRQERERHHVRLQGVVYEGRTEGMNEWKAPHAVKTQCRTWRKPWSAPTASSACRSRARSARRWSNDGGQADHLRDGQPRSGNHPGRRPRRVPGRHPGDRPVGLSEPGQQRAGLPLHLPRRARLPRQHNQRRDEAVPPPTRWPSSPASRCRKR